ncbi:MAG: dUTP diphosphatase [Clostridia bacterium]|nr:dUTP diphosphatase [Clostridia bacterium]
MDLNELFEIQDIIENRIKDLSDIEENSIGEENVFDLRFLALQVKTGEIANITKCYKYSKVKGNVPREKIIIRYMDALKFLLSIGNTHQFNIINKDAIEKVEKTDNVIKLFCGIFDDIRDLRQTIVREEYVDSLSIYIRLFARYVNLAECLGLSIEELYGYYINCT